jgi:very-short-patch-repair endonuclease
MPNDDNWQPSPATSPPHLWARLKPLARQKRHHPAPAENLLWECLRNRRIAGLKFRRQHAIERFIVDFYCAEAHLVVEVDGPIHDYTPEEDAIRQEFLESVGTRVIRFTNDDVLHHLDAVLEAIDGFLTPMPENRPESSPGERD